MTKENQPKLKKTLFFSEKKKKTAPKFGHVKFRL